MNRLLYFARETLVSLRRNVLMTLAGIITVGVSLSLFGGSMLFQQWVDHGTQRWTNGVEFEVFLAVDSSEQQVAGVRQELRDDPLVRDTQFIDKEAAYEEFKRLFSDKPDLVETTEAAFLPVSFRVAPEKAEDTETLVARYKTVPGVDSVVTAQDSIRQLLSITRFLRIMFLALALVLLSSSVFLIVNTIRLATFARRREIEVMKLVGASNWFVRVPFMAEGLVQGAIGAGLAVGGVFGLWWIFDRYRADDPNEFFFGFYVTVANAGRVAVVVVVVGAVIGVLGSLIGLRRFLRV